MHAQGRTGDKTSPPTEDPVAAPNVRTGEAPFMKCMRCGACCRAVRCPLYYTDDGGRGTCSIYRFRPRICIARADQDCLKGGLHAL